MLDFLLRFVDLKNGKVFFSVFCTSVSTRADLMNIVENQIRTETVAKPWCVVTFICSGLAGELDHWVDVEYTIEEWSRGGS